MLTTTEEAERYFLRYAGEAERDEAYWRGAFEVREDMRMAWAVLNGMIELEEWQEVDFAEIEERYERYWGEKRLVTDDIEMTERERAVVRLSPYYEHWTSLPDYETWKKEVARPGAWLKIGGRLLKTEIANLTYNEATKNTSVMYLPNREE